MRLTSSKWKVLASCAILLAAAGCSRTAPPQHAAPSRTSAVAVTANAGSTRDLWRSLTTGKEYRVKIQGDQLEADWVNVPPDAARRGTFIRTVCHRKGKKWVGTSQIEMSCTEGAGKAEHIANNCRFALPFEIDAINEQKISGRAPMVLKFQCGKCEVTKSVWRDFEWVPVGTQPGN